MKFSTCNLKYCAPYIYLPEVTYIVVLYIDFVQTEKCFFQLISFSALQIITVNGHYSFSLSLVVSIVQVHLNVIEIKNVISSQILSGGYRC